MAAASSSSPIRIFCGYHHEDKKFYEELRRHLTPLDKSGKIAVRHSDDVQPGEMSAAFLEEEIAETQILILLVSAALIGNEIWWSFWTPKVDAISKDDRRFVPVLVSTIDLADTSLAGRALLPRGGRALNAYSSWDAPCSDISKEIAEIVNRIRETELVVPVSTPESGGAFQSSEHTGRKRSQLNTSKHESKRASDLEDYRIALEQLEVSKVRNPNDVSLRTEQANLYDKIGRCECEQGRFDKAHLAFDSAFGIRTDLKEANVENDEVLFDLSTSHFWRGYLSYLEGDLGRAREEQLEGMSACQRLRRRDESNVKAGRSLVVLQTDLGTTLSELGETARSEETLREALSFARMLEKQYPENRQIYRDVSVGLFRLAELLVKLNRAVEATPLCEESIQMCRMLTHWAPSNVQWRRHLATARMSMGDVRLSSDQLTLARGDYEFAVGTTGTLAALDDDDVSGIRQHANSERKLGSLIERTTDHGGAMAAYIRAATAMETACDRVTSPRWSRELLDIYSALLRTHRLVPSADPEIAQKTQLKMDHLSARLQNASS